MARRPRRRERASRRPLLAALALSAVALAACNLITGLDADYSSSGRDAAVGVSEGGTPDGPGSDSPSGDDGSMTTEGGPDGSVVLSFCEKAKGDSQPDDFFCTDFENGLSFAGGSDGWTDMNNQNDAGKLAVVTDAGMDASRALEVIGNSTTTASADTRIRRTLLAMDQPYAYRSYDVAFDVLLADSTNEYEALGLLMFAQSDVMAREHGIAGYGPSPHFLSRQATGVVPSGTERIPNTIGWAHAHITLDHDSPTAAFKRTITIGGVKADDTTGHVIDAGAPTDFRLGVFYTPAKTGTAHVYFDNVVMRRRPF
jgi:hypothetical protein